MKYWLEDKFDPIKWYQVEINHSSLKRKYRRFDEISSLVALQIINMTFSNAAMDGNFITTFSF